MKPGGTGWSGDSSVVSSDCHFFDAAVGEHPPGHSRRRVSALVLGRDGSRSDANGVLVFAFVLYVD